MAKANIVTARYVCGKGSQETNLFNMNRETCTWLWEAIQVEYPRGTNFFSCQFFFSQRGALLTSCASICHHGFCEHKLNMRNNKLQCPILLFLTLQVKEIKLGCLLEAVSCQEIVVFSLFSSPFFPPVPQVFLVYAGLTCQSGKTKSMFCLHKSVSAAITSFFIDVVPFLMRKLFCILHAN